MTSGSQTFPKPARITVEVDEVLLERVRLAAAERELSVGEYAITAIKEYLGQHEEARSASVLTAATDPVLAELWDNPRDAAYDRL